MIKKISLLFISIITFSVLVHAQSRAEKYWVYFTDKNNSVYSVEHPEVYLSDAAIQRRAKMHIAINTSDLPVNVDYVKQLQDAGATITVESRWLNAVSISVPDETLLSTIALLPFVSKIEKVKHYQIIDDSGIPVDNTVFYRTNLDDAVSYGGAFNQNHMIDVDFLHNLGYRGQGIKIAVLDGGFYGVDFGIGFQSLRDKNQIIETINFPDDNDQVYISSTHGSNVLSIMAVDEPGKYIGSAPDAEYYLFRTEVVESERVVEEDYWMQAAEYADFIGADIINSSLGYTTFDTITEDHTYADMDGNTTVATIAADKAAAAGILVCNSAGNSGDEDWNFIGAPADADSIMTIGAVDLNGNYVSFSSQGPTADGRIKPNVAGQGAGTAVMDQSGVVYYGNGTSYSSPLIAGACASFMSAFPELTNMQVLEIIQSTASQADSPDNNVGYGIPNFAKAYLTLKGIDLPEDQMISIMPNPAADVVSIFITAKETGDAQVYIYDIAGHILYTQEISMTDGKVIPVFFNNLDILASGMYVIKLVGDVYTESQKFLVK